MSRRPSLGKILVVAKREFIWRGSGKAFLAATAFLVIVGVVIGLAPTLITYVSGGEKATSIALVEGSAAPGAGYRTGLEALLNASRPTVSLPGSKSGSSAGYTVVEVADLATARAAVLAGTYSGALALSRTTGDDLAATFYSGLSSIDRTTQLVQQAAAALAIQDRLTRAGVPAGSQGSIFAPASVELRPADPNRPDRADPAKLLVSGGGIAFVLTIFTFMAVIVYCQWVAMSVAEEKSSRVMELILGAARPFELLAGKVLGVGGLGLLQLVVVTVPAAAAVLLQQNVASLLLGGSASSVTLPEGLTPGLMVAFVLFFVLGFALYSTLFAAVASLVSRQEDVNTLITPLILVATAGYLVAVYASLGVVPMDSALVIVLSYVPFLSPYLMLTRVAVGAVQPVEPAIAIALLAVTIVAALWVAARLYAAGVLIYGQKASFRNLVTAFRRA